MWLQTAQPAKQAKPRQRSRNGIIISRDLKQVILKF
jgi:hypothetical protein